MLQWSIEKKILELKYVWKISRNASSSKTNFLINLSDGTNRGMGEVAPNIRYHESPELIEQQFSLFTGETEKLKEISSVEELHACFQELSLCNSLRFGIESAFIHYICNKKKISVPHFLKIPDVRSVPVSYSIPIMETGMMKAFYEENNLKRFRFIKIKVNSEESDEVIKHLSSFCHQPLIVDANEAFNDVENCIGVFEKVKNRKIEFIEQPLSSLMIEESIYLKKHSPFTLFADESISDKADFSKLRLMFDGINVKLMKAGGYLNALRLLQDAKANKMKTMIGCMIETSLGISSGLHFCSLADYADLDSFLVVKNEPFGLLKEENGVISHVN